MQIALRELTFDGVGPFGGKETFDISPTGKTIIYAPNGHGKTATVDLVRWLFLGDAAQSEFRSIEGVVNKARAKSVNRVGVVEAVVEIEERGVFRLRRAASVGLPSKLTIAREERGRWEEELNPDAFLLRYFPPERIGFNLLTGEHVREFAKEVKEARVKESVEKLLRFPEIALANNALASLAQVMERREEDARRLKKSAFAAGQRAQKVVAELTALESKISETEERRGKAADEVARINKQIGALEASESPSSKLDDVSRMVKKQHEAQVREWENIQMALGPSWRALVKAAAGRHSSRVIRADEEYQDAAREWARRQAEIAHYRDVLALSECICTRPIDQALRSELERRVGDLERFRPPPPAELAVPIHMLKGWRDNDEVAALVERLAKSHRDYDILCQDMEVLEKQAASLKRRAKEGSPEELRELRRELGRHERLLSSIDFELRKLSEQRNVLRDEAAEARKKAAKEAGTEDVLGLASIVDDYRRAFQELVSLSVPYYRRKLEERVQILFASLYQKDPDARIAFEGSSYLPRIRTADGAAPSEGEKLRLGIALLLAFRDIAAEQPFLFLDAPFAELDDEGIDRLLTLLGDQDSQIVILTKNRFPREPFKLVERMQPATYEMVFDPASKVTSLRSIPLTELLRSDSR